MVRARRPLLRQCKNVKGWCQTVGLALSGGNVDSVVFAGVLQIATYEYPTKATAGFSICFAATDGLGGLPGAESNAHTTAGSVSAARKPPSGESSSSTRPP